ncbi:NAD(P)/FAD-dependent oxidoreductase [Microbulbifer sp. Q7]|uniref:flavin monoamine oxidase family protein n=1 Tax=Microbulbifer sp. Q7 TaxID=1785091 RepID=UPI00082C3AB9|nr:NAD(P)/FAD-dependent oxidoreductase [Microbulbifer sp. Q7]
MRSRKSLSPLSSLMRRLGAAQELSEKTGISSDESLDIINEGTRHVGANASEEGRRQFLKQLGLGAAALGTAGATSTFSGPAKADPSSAAGRVAVIGGGVAGVRCAHRLQQYGIASKVFEGNTRLGGRVSTNRSIFGRPVERGGELISTEHTYTRNLASNLGLDVEDVNGNAVPGGNELYYVNGQHYTEHQLNAEWRDVYQIFKRAQQDAPWVPTYESNNAMHRELDHIDVNSWLDYVGIGANSNMGQVFQADIVAEYGIQPEETTALNLIYLLAWNPINTALPLAGTDERFRIAGGNDQLVTRMVEELPEGTIETARKLVAIQGNLNGPYNLVFEDGYEYTCDRLVLALPFSTLRDVDIDPRIYNGFRPQKRMAIERMAFGSNGKMAMQCASRPWTQPQVVNGELFTPNGVTYVGRPELFDTWDSTSVTGGTDGILVNFFGGDYGKQIGSDQPFAAPTSDDLNHFFGIVDNVFPGTSNAFTGTAMLSKWSANPWSKGSYSTQTFGDYTEWWGSAGLQEGNIHFCGEHTALEAFGYIDGAISTAERAAKEIRQV